MNIQAAQVEDDVIESLKKDNANLRRSIKLLRRNAEINAGQKNMMTVDDFCFRNSMSRGTYYALLADGLVPQPITLTNKKGEPVMRRQFIKLADEKEWLGNKSNFMTVGTSTFSPEVNKLK